MRITEIFLSLQGESSHAGLPCVFVRLTGCSLRCVWCDSAYAFTGGTERSIEDVVGEVVSLGAPIVEITGGEPLEQEGFYPLCERLLALGKTVLVAGLLAASANAAFADNRGDQQQPRQRRDRTSQNQPAPTEGPVTAITKDGKAIQVTVDVPILNKGVYTEDQFKRSLRGGIMMSAMQTFAQYTEADIQKNIGEIQKKMAAGIGAMVPLGTVTAGKPDYAKPGVNYGTPQVTRVAEVAGGKVVLEQKAPPKPAGKAPGA